MSLIKNIRWANETINVHQNFVSFNEEGVAEVSDDIRDILLSLNGFAIVDDKKTKKEEPKKSDISEEKEEPKKSDISEEKEEPKKTKSTKKNTKK